MGASCFIQIQYFLKKILSQKYFHQLFFTQIFFMKNILVKKYFLLIVFYTCKNRGLLASSPVLQMWRAKYGSNAHLRAHEPSEDEETAEEGRKGGRGDGGGGRAACHNRPAKGTCGI